jgi:hypothetical protein
MHFTEGRLSYLAHHIVATLKREGLATVESERHVLNRIKAVLAADREHEARIDAFVRRRIESLSRNVPPGSREWDVLYQKYFAEESRKQKT